MVKIPGTFILGNRIQRSCLSFFMWQHWSRISFVNGCMMSNCCNIISEDKKLLRICLPKVLTTADQCWKSLLKGQYEADLYTLDEMQKKLTLQRYQFEVNLIPNIKVHCQQNQWENLTVWKTWHSVDLQFKCHRHTHWCIQFGNAAILVKYRNIVNKIIQWRWRCVLYNQSLILNNKKGEEFDTLGDKYLSIWQSNTCNQVCCDVMCF